MEAEEEEEVGFIGVALSLSSSLSRISLTRARDFLGTQEMDGSQLI
jgi:hypothetical protein